MSADATVTDLITRLSAGDIVPLSEKVWTSVAEKFKLVAEIDTHLAGTILLVRRPGPPGKRSGWALVEEPEYGRRVIRPLADEKSARALIAERLAAYERMWDG
jgi:hypothetical protein